MSTAVHFDKYDVSGAYHWRGCDRRSRAFSPTLVARYEMLLKRVPGGRALDVGAGDGYLTGRLADLCEEAVGVEYEPTAVELGRRLLADRPNATIEQGSAYELPFADASFDVVAMADVIEHLDRPADAASEMARVVKPDGVVLVTTPHKRPDRVWDERHVIEFTADDLREMLSGAFSQVELRFAWPKAWYSVYHTRVGGRALRELGRLGFNPFAQESPSPAGFHQILAICRR